MPSSTNIQGAYGTTATCTWQATFLQLGAASFAYSLMLILYYVFIIRYNKTELWISKVEPWMHVVPIAYYFATAITGIVWQIFNPTGLHCWVGVYPLDCDEDPLVECQRGEGHVDFFGLWLLVVPLMVINTLLVFALVVIAVTVWKRQRSTHKVIVGSNTEHQTRQVLIQCFLYAISFVNVMAWSTLGTILSLAKIEYQILEQHFWIAALSVFFFPLQGLFNFLIFIRPRYLSKRQTHGRCAALREAVWNPGASSMPASSLSRHKSNAVLQQQQLEGEIRECSPRVNGDSISGSSSSSRQAVNREEKGDAIDSAL